MTPSIKDQRRQTPQLVKVNLMATLVLGIPTAVSGVLVWDYICENRSNYRELKMMLTPLQISDALLASKVQRHDDDIAKIKDKLDL